MTMAVAGGAVVPLGFAPFGIWVIPIVSLALFLALIEDASPRDAAWLGFGWGAATFLTGTYWLYHSLHVLGGAPLLLALLLMLALIASMGAYAAGFGWLYRRVDGRGLPGVLLLAPIFASILSTA